MTCTPLPVLTALQEEKKRRNRKQGGPLLLYEFVRRPPLSLRLNFFPTYLDLQVTFDYEKRSRWALTCPDPPLGQIHFHCAVSTVYHFYLFHSGPPVSSLPKKYLLFEFFFCLRDLVLYSIITGIDSRIRPNSNGKQSFN